MARIWFVPGNEKKYGCVCAGTDGSPAFGMNEEGLFFMGQLNSFVDASSTYGKPFVTGILYIKLMYECASVDEVAAMLGKYNLKLLERTKLIFGDKYGNSLIAEGDTLVYGKGEYQICRAMITQARPTEPRSEYAYYRKADEYLGRQQIIDTDVMKETLKRTFQNDNNRTICSGIFDLENGMVSLYYYQDLENAYSFRLSEELEKGRRTIDMPDIFRDNVKGGAHCRYVQKKRDEWKASRQMVRIEPSVYKNYTGVYRAFIDGVPWNISIMSDGGKLWYSTSEFGRGELFPTSERTFFMVDYNGIYDVEFDGDTLITRFGAYRYLAEKLSGDPPSW